MGRDTIPLARLGFDVLGVDNSGVGVKQMLDSAKKEDLILNGQVKDVFEFNNFEGFDFILLDSMFHFAKKDKQKETNLIRRIIIDMDSNARVIICIQDTGKKVKILRETLEEVNATPVFESRFDYIFEDKESDHKSKTAYQMIVAGKNVSSVNDESSATHNRVVCKDSSLRSD